jgi:hypothetical protein
MNNSIQILLVYWIVTTIYMVYWMIKEPPFRHSVDPDENYDREYVTLLEVLGYIFPAAAIGWYIVPIHFIQKVKFKRFK